MRILRVVQQQPAKRQARGGGDAAGLLVCWCCERWRWNWGFESCRRSLACTAPAGEGLLRGGALRAASRGRRALHCAAGGLALAVLVESARPPPVWSGWRLAPWTGWRGWKIIPSLLAARAPTRRHKNTAADGARVDAGECARCGPTEIKSYHSVRLVYHLHRPCVVTGSRVRYRIWPAREASPPFLFLHFDFPPDV
jgi:hypothetical protein